MYICFNVLSLHWKKLLHSISKYTTSGSTDTYLTFLKNILTEVTVFPSSGRHIDDSVKEKGR